MKSISGMHFILSSVYTNCVFAMGNILNSLNCCTQIKHSTVSTVENVLSLNSLNCSDVHKLCLGT